MSKGSNQRPKAVDDETFRSNWEATFGGLQSLVQGIGSPATSESKAHAGALDRVWKEIHTKLEDVNGQQ